MKDCLLSSIRARFAYVFDNEIFLAASFLDYIYKNFEFFWDANKAKTNLKRTKAYLLDIYKSNIIKNGPCTSTQVTQAVVVQTQTEAQSQSEITLTDNNPRRKQPGILLSTQDKNKVKSKHVLDLEIKMYQTFEWCTSDQALAKAHGPLLFYKQNSKTFPLLSKLAKYIFCMLPASLASERLFRGSGRIVTTDRNSLAPKTLEYLTQIKNNRVA